MNIDENIICNLIKKFDAPLYFYDESIIKRRIQLLKNAFPNFDLFYSVKSNPNRHICEYVKRSGNFVDVSSIGEVRLAIQSGFTKDEIIYSSPGKKENDIEEALGKCIIIADSLDEIKLIDSICIKQGIIERIGIRINPDFTLNNSDALEIMSGCSSKFGIDQEKINEHIDLLKSYKGVQIKGIQIYMGSQILNYKTIYLNFCHIFDVARYLIKDLELDLSFIDFGGGFGIQYTEEDEELDLTTLSQLIDLLLNEPRFKELSQLRLIIESGRFISGPAGNYVAKVLDVKESRGKKYAIIDGGMNTFFRPVFIKENKYPITVINKQNDEKREQISLAGVMCTPIDIYVENVNLPILKKGDIIAFQNAGAYGYTMSLTKFIGHQEAKELYITEDKKILTVEENV